MLSNEGNPGGASGGKNWWRTVLAVVIAAVVAVIVFLAFKHYLRIPATIVLFAGVFTYLLQPVVQTVERCCKKHNPHLVRVCAVLLVYLLLAGSLYLFGASALASLNRDARSLQSTWEQWIAPATDGSGGENSQRTPNGFPQQFARVSAWYQGVVPYDVRLEIQTRIQDEVQKLPAKYAPGIVPWVLGIAKTAGEWLSMLIELIFVPLVAFYFLTDARRLREQILYFVPSRYRNPVLVYASGMGKIVSRYVQSQLLLCVIADVVVTVALLLLGIPGAFLLGLIAGISRGIPVIGPVLGGIPVLAGVLIHSGASPTFWWVLVGFMLLHLFESKYLMPRILGEHLGLHPVLIILSLLIGYQVFGLLGMFLAPPVAAILRFILAVHRGEDPFPRTSAATPQSETEAPVAVDASGCAVPGTK